MTTPERQRRRVRRIGWGLIILGIVVGLVSWYFHGQDVEQRHCVTNTVRALTKSLDARSDIAARESRATKMEGRATRLESKANNDFYRQAFASSSQAEVFDAYGRYRVSLAKVNAMRAKVDNRREHIAEDRADHPIPAFPAGTCD